MFSLHGSAARLTATPQVPNPLEIIKLLSLLWEGLHVNQSPKGDSFLKLPMAFPPLGVLFFNVLINFLCSSPY